MSAVGGPTIQAIQVACTFPKGSTFANQHVIPIDIGDVWCYSVEVQIPDGPKGNLAIALQYAGTQIVPWGVEGGFLQADNYEKSFPVDAELGQGLQLVGFNTGNFDHTAFLRFLVVPIAAYGAGVAAAPAPALDLSGLGL